jgi:hypothetical protein
MNTKPFFYESFPLSIEKFVKNPFSWPNKFLKTASVECLVFQDMIAVADTVSLHAGLEKTRVFFKPNPVVFLSFFFLGGGFVFFGFLGVFLAFFGFFTQKREFLGFFSFKNTFICSLKICIKEKSLYYFHKKLKIKKKKKHFFGGF